MTDARETTNGVGGEFSDGPSLGVIRWPAEAIWEAVVPDLPGFTVEVLPQVDSTNTELMRRAHAGQQEPILLVAEQQTAGRGRMGRQWHSEATGVGAIPLTFSLGLPLSPADWSGLSLAVGISVAQSLHPDLRLKWPNDIWLQGRKLAGILIETASFAGSRYLVIGVGINIAARSAGGLSTPPAWLAEVLPGVDAPQALLRLVPPLVRAVQGFEACGFAPLRQRFDALDALTGQVVVLSDGTLGTARGVDASGALLVHTSAGMKTINSSEVSVRPAAQGC
jgi:BirA family transcriptional regulator, biotin operon repressor / biotin---[acetyl-CoA-carboxylase] ligase